MGNGVSQLDYNPEEGLTLGYILKNYTKVIIAFSGGKDSLACLLHVIELGVPVSMIELWHHDVDGKGPTIFDWEVTPSYCKAIAKHFGIPIYFSWKVGGFLGEMLRDNVPTNQTAFETPEGEIKFAGGNGDPGTRMKFPQVGVSLTTRWCSAYLKIDICGTAIRNQERFKNTKTLLISGERGEESTARSKYFDFEIDRSSSKDGSKLNRVVHRWRPIKNWLEQEVWAIIERFKIRAHPTYYLGWGRVSCKWCIFGSPDQMASAYLLSPNQGENLIHLENHFGVTLKRNIDLRSFIEKGTPYETITAELMEIALSEDYDLEIVMEDWYLPAGAYGESCGPT